MSKTLTVGADHLDAIVRDLRNGVDHVAWSGGDAAEFKRLLEADLGPRVERSSSKLRGFAKQLTNQARQQTEASRAEGIGGIGGIAGIAGIAGILPRSGRQLDNSVIADGTNRISSPKSAADYMKRLEALGPGELEIVRLGGDPPRYAVLLKGVDSLFDPSTGNRTDLEASLAESFGKGGKWSDAIKTALADATAADVAAGRKPQVMLMGHSGGGIVAANLASDPKFNGMYNVSDVVIAGSGVGDKMARIPEATNVLMINHSRDVVAQKIQSPVFGSTIERGYDAMYGSGKHQYEVFGSQGLNQNTGTAFGVSGHDVPYYENHLRNIDGTNSIVASINDRYTSGGTVDSFRYRLPD